MNHNFHSTLEENPHRLLNVLLEGTYVRPHRHLDPPKSESFLVLEGRAVVFTFDGQGQVIQAVTLGMDPDCDCIGAELPPGTWHTILATTPCAVCYEVKPGPYQKINDKDFAAWAPAEGDPAVPAYIASLLDRVNQPHRQPADTR